MALIVLNFKTYKEAMGEGSIKLSQIAKEVSQQTGVKIIVAPQATDIFRTSKLIETFAQHIDNIEPGAGTGYVLAESVLQNGGKGSLLNHSEHRIPAEEIEKAIIKLRKLGLKSIACAKDDEEAKELALLNPDFIAIEPPELIGTGISVSTAQPELIKKSVSNIHEANKKVKILCGAGISSGTDCRQAKKLGVEGVLLASAFVKAKDPKAVLFDIAKGVK